MLLRQAKEWYIDVTFDMWQGYICSVVYKSKHFDRYMTAFVYLHESKGTHDHVKALNHLASTLKLSKEEQKQYLLVSDGESSIINAWCTNFPHMPQERCSLHFMKNIHDKLHYHLPHRPTKPQIKNVLSLFNGLLEKFDILDMSADEVKENKDKILHAV